MDIQHTWKHLKLAEIEGGGGAHAGKDALACTCGTVDVDSCFHHHIDHCIDLFFGGLLLHCYDHCFVPVSGASAPVSWPCSSPWRAWAFLSDANSFLCRARITSMIRS